jgi:hypothetical protein
VTVVWARSGSDHHRDVIEAALAYARLGIEVLPVHTIDDEGLCTCALRDACMQPGKHPRTQNGYKDATTHESTIEAWWARWPDASIGARPRSIGLVIDVDSKTSDPENDGHVWLERLEQTIGALPQTMESFTGGGGRHLWFRCEPRKTELAKWSGIDIISATGYVIMPPSRHRSRKTYEWEASSDPVLNPSVLFDIPELPEAYLMRMEQPQEQVLAGEQNITLSPAPPGALENIQEQLNAIHPTADCDCDTWVKAGMAIHINCWMGGFEVWRDWSSLSEAGKFNPGECERRWRTFKVYPEKHGLKSVGLGTLSREAKGSKVIPPHSVAFDSSVSEPSGNQLDRTSPEGALKSLRLIRESELTDNLVKKPEIVEGLIPQESLVQFFGPSGAGKSFLAIDLAMHLATGKMWAEKQVRKMSVVYVNGEGRHALGRRLKAWKTHHQMSGKELEFHVTESSLAMLDSEHLMHLIEAVKGVRAEAVFIDTLARNFGAGGDENSTADMNLFVTACEALQRATDASVFVVHHTGHATQDRARGSGALHAACDVEFRITRDGPVTTVQNTKQRDLEEAPDLMFRASSVEFAGGDGELLNSLVLFSESAAKVEVNLIQESARELLQVLQQMQSETRSRLDAMGKVQEVASVSRRALRERLSDVTDVTLRQRLKRLVDAGAIEMDRHTVRVIFNVTQNVTGT